MKLVSFLLRDGIRVSLNPEMVVRVVGDSSQEPSSLVVSLVDGKQMVFSGSKQAIETLHRCRLWARVLIIGNGLYADELSLDVSVWEVRNA